MKFEKTDIEGVWLIHTERHRDVRGYFAETFRADAFAAATGINPDFVQENESESRRGVVRGLHFQRGEHAQAKLVRVAEGAIWDVAVDLRPGSPTYGRYVAYELSQDNGRQLFIPRGFAHGFAVLSSTARFLYKVDNYYCPQSEGSVRFDDPALGVQWPLTPQEMILSPKDLAAPLLKDAIL